MHVLTYRCRLWVALPITFSTTTQMAASALSIDFIDKQYKGIDKKKVCTNAYATTLERTLAYEYIRKIYYFFNLP